MIYLRAKGSEAEPDDLTDLELVDVSADTEAYVPVGSIASDEPMLSWDEDSATWRHTLTHLNWVH